MKTMNYLLIGFLSIGLIVSAQTSDGKVAIGLNYVRNEYNGDFGNEIFNFGDYEWYNAGGLSLATFLNHSFDMGLQASFGNYGYTESTANQFSGSKLDVSLFTHYKLNNGYILSKKSKLSPFLSLGLGFAGYGINNNAKPYPTIVTKGVDVILPLGAGLKYQFTNKFAIQYQYLYTFTNADNHDQNRGVDFFGSTSHPGYKGGDDIYGQHVLGVIFSFGGSRDADGDGVSDRIDKCPDTPKGVAVDALGCPIDSDNDGVPDYLDKCPDTTINAKVDDTGCPIDSDGDGVPDYLDQCPNTPEGIQVDATGCSIDSDGDGIPDYMDKCPGTPAGETVNANGCPFDSDGDGVADQFDKCPDTPVGVKVDASGCPLDSDGDGVPDYLDKCADIPGLAANKGCPEVNTSTKKIFEKALRGIQFESGRDIIKRSSNIILNEVVIVMIENPTYNLEINGHTDNLGSAAMNLNLSQRRANAVKNYLIRCGIDGSRVTAKGYGPTMPVASNATSHGRSKNRRVEFKVNF